MKSLVVLFLAVACMFAAVTSGTSHYSDAVAVNTLIAGSFRSSTYEVNIHYDQGAYNYYILWDGVNGADDAASKMIASIVSCAVVSNDTSWSSGYVVIGFMNSGTAWEISTANARYVSQNAGSRGSAWAQSYIADHMTQIL